MIRKIPDYLSSTYEMLECAFPEGVPDELFLPLLKALYAGMSFGGVAQVISLYTEIPEYEAKHFAVKAETSVPGDDPCYKEVLRRLEECGYSNWLEYE